MSDYSQISGEHIVSLFRDHARQYGPNHVTTKDCEAELLRRLRARSVEGLVERVRILLKDDGTSHDPYVRPDQIYALICEWEGATDGQ